jgi:hypothetical protein
MRVEVVESLAEADAPRGKEFSDIAVERGLKNFFAALESDDSLFVTETFVVAIADDATGGKTCGGTIALRFRDESHARNRGLHFSLIEKLAELLKEAGSAESLTARLAIAGRSGDDSKPELGIRMRLDSKGNSAEQAALRWSLGLAHVQQALLFTSRFLRQQTGQA